MGRLRTAVRTLADLELPPGELLFHLNDLVSGLGDDFYATCLYAVYDPTRHVCSIARAGHPPPAVVRADGAVYFPDLPVVPPLGAATPPFDTCELALPEDSVARALHRRPGRDGGPGHPAGDGGPRPRPHHRGARAHRTATAPIPTGCATRSCPPCCRPESTPTTTRPSSSPASGPSPPRTSPPGRCPTTPGGRTGPRPRPRSARRMASGRSHHDHRTAGQRAGGQCRPPCRRPHRTAPAAQPGHDLRSVRRQPGHTADPAGGRPGRGRPWTATGRRPRPSVGRPLHRPGKVHLDGAALGKRQRKLTFWARASSLE